MRGWLLRRRLRRLSWEELLAAGYAWKVTDDCKLELVSLKPGTPPDGGSLKPSASTGTKEPGTPTPETGTTAGCSFWYPLGDQSEGRYGLISQAHASNSFGPGSSTAATATPGVSGAPRGRVV